LIGAVEWAGYDILEDGSTLLNKSEPSLHPEFLSFVQKRTFVTDQIAQLRPVISGQYLLIDSANGGR